jgi:predicted nucleic acid-binding Zn ribbon protein
MDPKRRRRGFERVGSFRPEQLGLPKGRTNDLQLALAWKRVAGDAIARHAMALRVRRGVLEVEVQEGRWAATVRDLMRRLTGRLAAACPELGVRKFRLLEVESERVVDQQQ